MIENKPVLLRCAYGRVFDSEIFFFPMKGIIWQTRCRKCGLKAVYPDQQGFRALFLRLICSLRKVLDLGKQINRSTPEAASILGSRKKSFIPKGALICIRFGRSDAEKPQE
jgi:hypothetical protein